LIQNQFI